MLCSNCNADLTKNHTLEDIVIPPMSNKSRIIYPKCSLCNQPIYLPDTMNKNIENSKVLLITGTAGAGKTALGQLIESRSNYIFLTEMPFKKRLIISQDRTRV